MTIKHNIKLTEQPNHTIVKVNPSQEWLTENKYNTDGSEYVEQTFTGDEDQITQKRDQELAKGGESQQVTTTMSRLNGGLWQLQIRYTPLKKQSDDNDSSGDDEDISQEESQWGSEVNPRQVSISITAIQESVLNHPKFANLSADKRGAIKAYMNGAMEGQQIADKNGKAMRLGQIISMSDNLVQLALKCPTYYVPSIAVTLQYYKSSPVNDISGIGEEKDAPGFGKLPEGYTSLFMGCSSSPQGKGYIIQESYTIGKFNTDLSEDTE